MIHLVDVRPNSSILINAPSVLPQNKLSFFLCNSSVLCQTETFLIDLSDSSYRFDINSACRRGALHGVSRRSIDALLSEGLMCEELAIRDLPLHVFGLAYSGLHHTFIFASIIHSQISHPNSSKLLLRPIHDMHSPFAASES